MVRSSQQSVDLLWLTLCLGLVNGGSVAPTGTCNEVKAAYMMRQIGPVQWVPDSPASGESLSVCRHLGLTCCTPQMEQSYMSAVRSETQQKIRSYSFELKYLITGHNRAYQEALLSLLLASSNQTSSLLDSAYSSLAAECRPLVFRLFSDVQLHLSGEAGSLDRAVHRFYDDLFPLVYRRLLNPGIGRGFGHTYPKHQAPPSPSPPTNHDECLRMTRQDVNPFGPHSRLLVTSLSRALGAGRALSQLLGLAGEVVNATERAVLSRECGRGLVRMQYCSHCRGLTLIRPCTGLCVNIMRGCLVGVSELASPWWQLVVLLQRSAAALATSSGNNSMELALLAIRNHVNDAILHAQLHGPRITATVEKVCGPQTHGPVMTPSLRLTTAGDSATTPVTSSPTSVTSSPATVTLSHPTPYQEESLPWRSLPAKGPRGDRNRSLKKLSREFQGSIGRYQGFFRDLPGLLCESEMEVDQQPCWDGQDVVESYTGVVVGSSFKAQKQNPEMSVRNSDSILKVAKERLEHLIKEVRTELGWVASGGEEQEEDEEEEGGSGWRERGSGREEEEECDDEDGCQGSGGNGEGESEDIFSGRSPGVKDTPPRRPPAPPRVAVRGSAHTFTSDLSPLTQVAALLLLNLLLLPWEPL